MCIKNGNQTLECSSALKFNLHAELINSLTVGNTRLLAIEYRYFCKIWKEIEQIRIQIKTADQNRIFPPLIKVKKSLIKVKIKEKKNPLITQLPRETINLANKIRNFHYMQGV